ncbi:unnamed protein product, partial [Didymodactylos carnosus]
SLRESEWTRWHPFATENIEKSQSLNTETILSSIVDDDTFNDDNSQSTTSQSMVETILFSIQAKLYKKLTKKWKLISKGEIEIVKHKKNGIVRLRFWRSSPIELLLVQYVSSDNFQFCPTRTNLTVCWKGRNICMSTTNSSNNTSREGKIQKYAIKFTNRRVASDFRDYLIKFRNHE